MRAVVTGSEGFLGANLCRALVAAGHDVVGTSHNRKNHTSLDALGVSCRIEYGDVNDGGFLSWVIAGWEADWVFHLAATSIVRVAEAHPAAAIMNNIAGTVGVLECARRLPHVKAVVVASSDKAYGDHGGKPYREDMPLLPVSPYEVSKACADLIAQSYAATYGLNVKVARCANLYGPGDLHWSRIVPNSCRLALAGKAPVVHAGAESMQREYLHVSDACSAYIRLAEAGAPGAYNVGSGQTATTIFVAEAIAKFLDAPAPSVERRDVPFREIPAQELSTVKMRRLGWEPVNELRAGLSWTAAWYRFYLRPEAPACSKS